MTSGELKAWRKRFGLTEGQAAEALGISIDEVAPAISFDRRTLIAALRSKIKDKFQSNGPPGSITPKIFQEILLEMVDVIQMDDFPRHSEESKFETARIGMEQTATTLGLLLR